MTARLVDGKPVYPTEEEARVAQAKQVRWYGIFSGVVRNGDGWSLRYDLTGGVT